MEKARNEGLSAGESEIAAFSLLWAVNETSETRYPIVQIVLLTMILAIEITLLKRYLKDKIANYLSFYK